jgi:hypothetical protein
MKRHFILIVAAFLVLTSAAGLIAEEAVLIDFNKLTADILPQQDPADPQKTVNTQNSVSMMDFSALAGQSFTEDQKKVMKTSLAMSNWEVVLASSSRTNTNQSLSITKEVKVLDTAPQYKGQKVLGIRIHFPEPMFNSWARVKTPFEIPAYEKKAKVDQQGTITPDTTASSSDPTNAKMTRFEGAYDPNTKVKTAYGVVKNVGVIKKVAVNVKGLNFPHSLTVILKDSNNDEQEIFMGYLNFDGWQEKTWENPAYVRDIKNRELRIFPLYPKNTPFVKFDSFLIKRDGSHDGGDFVTYIKDVKILYDKAVINLEEDIDDEAEWGIIQTRENARTKAESSRFGQMQVLRYLETIKQDKSESFTPSDGSRAATGTSTK